MDELKTPEDNNWAWKVLLVFLLFIPTCNGKSCGQSVAVRGCDVATEAFHAATSTKTR